MDCYTRFHDNGQLAERSQLRDSKRHGLSTTWFPSGQLESCEAYLSGQRDGVSEGWHERGGKKAWSGAYRAGHREGLWTEYHANGLPSSQVLYTDGVPDGQYRSWYATAVLEASCFYAAGVQHGRVTWYYPNGRECISYDMQNGLREGPSVLLDEETGRPSHLYMYEAGVLLSERDLTAEPGFDVHPGLFCTLEMLIGE
jgi:antitoxin component YwqK of YwqJK toxin-antitoxin module